MEQLPKIVRERLQAQAKPEVHPDPDLLTAFAENSLTERERLLVFAHLSSCSDCRELVSLAQPELAMEHVAAMAAAPAASPGSTPRKPLWSQRLILGWGTLAACAAIGVALLHYQTREKNLAQLAARSVSAEPNVEPAPAPAADATTQPAAPPPANQLEARLQPPPKSKFEGQPDKNSVRELPRRAAPQPMEKKFGAVGGVVGGAASARAGVASRIAQIPPSSQQVTVTSQAEAVSVEAKPQENIPLQARSPGVAGKDMVAEPTPSAVAKENQPATPPPTNTASPATSATTSSLSAFAGQQAAIESNQAAVRQKVALARVSSNYLPARWTISSDGSTLLRTIGEGGSWTVVKVANDVVLKAVAALGSEVWAGGKAAALYHSTDLGMHWTQVKPSADGVPLSADIVSIDAPDPQHAKLTTSEAKIWTTTDAGKTWQTQ